MLGDPNISGVGGGGYNEGARVYNSVSINIPNDTWTTLTFDSERYDRDAIHSTVSNTGRLICKTAGIYQIVGYVSFAPNATGLRAVRIVINGDTSIAYNAVPGFTIVAVGPTFTPTAQYDLAVNDYVELLVYQNIGDNLALVYQANTSPEFSMQRIG